MVKLWALWSYRVHMISKVGAFLIILPNKKCNKCQMKLEDVKALKIPKPNTIAKARR